MTCHHARVHTRHVIDLPCGHRVVSELRDAAQMQCPKCKHENYLQRLREQLERLERDPPESWKR